MNRATALLLLSVFAACSNERPAAQDLSQVAGSEQVQLIRDARGIPHIVADTMAGAMYTVGYAQAQDRLAQMHVARMLMRGRSAELFAVSYDVSVCEPQCGTQNHPPCSPECIDQRAKKKYTEKLIYADREMRTFGYLQHAQAIWRTLPDDTADLLLAYSAGVNQYLADATHLDSGLRKLGLTAEDVFPWGPVDCILAWDRLGRFNAQPVAQARKELENLEGCSAGSCPTGTSCDERPPIDEQAAVVPPPANGVWPPEYPDDSLTALLQPPRLPASYPQGGDRHPPIVKTASHGWVAHGSKTDTGKPMLVGDPKLTLTAPSYFYQYHLVVRDEQLNAQVLTVPGAGGAMFMGWNENISQTITAGGGDYTDTFKLTAGQSPNTYLVDGHQLTFETRTETIVVREADPITFTVKTSIYGPVLTPTLFPTVADLVTDDIYVASHAPLVKMDSHSIVAGIKLIRAKSLTQYRHALRHWMAPAVNALYAGVDQGAPVDDPGHIAFHSLYSMPVRAQNISFGLDFTGRIPHDGSVRANTWQGFYDLNWHPHVIDPASGYLFSANHLAVGSWYHDLVYSGLNGNGDGFRSLRLRYLLKKLAADNGGKLPTRELHLAHYDAQSSANDIVHEILTGLADRGEIQRPGDLSAKPKSIKQRAGYTLQVLDLWKAAGGQIERSNAYSRLTGLIMSSLVKGNRILPGTPPLNTYIQCTWGNLVKLLKAMDKNPALRKGNEALYILTAAADAYDRTFANEPGLPRDPHAWRERPLAQESALYLTDLYCPNYQHCSLDPQEDVHYQLDRDATETLADPRGASFPFTVNFKVLDHSRALLAPGISGDPASPRFDNTIHLTELNSRGVDAIPRAPLSLDGLPQAGAETLVVPRAVIDPR